jgi:hypothetical protein
VARSISLFTNVETMPLPFLDTSSMIGDHDHYQRRPLLMDIRFPRVKPAAQRKQTLTEGFALIDAPQEFFR